MKKNLLVISSFTLTSYLSFSQNVGIGTSNPTRAKLELHGAVDATTAIFGGESTGISLQRNWPGIGFNAYYNNGDRYIANGFAAKQFLDPNSGYLIVDMYPLGVTNALVPTYKRALAISSSGNIGIGGVIPNAPLQFVNELKKRKIVLWESADNDQQFFGFGIESGALRYSVGSSDDAHRFYSGDGSYVSTLLAELSGSPTSATLNVFRGTGSEGTAIFRGSLYNSHFNYSYTENTYIRGGAPSSKVFINDIPNGRTIIGVDGSRVGINVDDPTRTLDIYQPGNSGGILLRDHTDNSRWELRSLYFNGSSLDFYCNGANVAWVSSTGEWFELSDIRLKKDVQPLANVMDGLLSLKPISYRMKSDNANSKKTIGFSAQALKKVFPEVVSAITDSATGYKEITDLHMVNYGGLSVIAIKAIQEQQKQIEALKKEIEELKNLMRK